MPVVIRTADVAVEDRFAYYKDALASAPVPLLLQSYVPSEFDLTMNQTALGELTVVSLTSTTSGPYQLHRNNALIRQSDPAAYRVIFNASGASGLEYNGRQLSLGQRDLALYDTSLPFRGWRGSCGLRNDWVMVTFPRALLPLHAQGIRAVLGATLPGNQGIGALVGDVLCRVAKDGDQYRPADALRLSTTVLDLLALLIAEHTQTPEIVSAESLRRALLVRIKAFIEHRLGDPDLSPGVIAAAHHISTRYLHALCHEDGITVSGWVRARRLERCRRDLADPLLVLVPIQVIGARWGLRNPAQLCRLFRAAYGMSPREYRLLHATGQQTE